MNWHHKRVLVTGAEGFIGSHLVGKLLAEGAQVHALVKRGSSLWRIEESIKSINLLEGDITDFNFLQSTVPKCRPQIVFHLAARLDVSRSWELVFPLIETNLSGTVNLLRVLKDCRIKLFVQTSSSEEYGDAPSPLIEDRRESPISPYSFSKVASTHFCQMVARAFDIPVTVVRLFPTYGPFQDGSMFIPSAIRELLIHHKFKMSPGEQKREFNYVDDIVRAYLAVAECPRAPGELFNIGNGIPYRLKDVVAIIKDLCGENALVEIGAIPYRKGEGKEIFCSNEKIKRLTGWSPLVSLEEGLKLTVEWYKKNLGKG